MNGKHGVLQATNYINGVPCTHPLDRWLDSMDPATGKVIGRYAPADADMAEAAALAARRAFETTAWSRDARLRAAVLLRFADNMIRAKDAIVDLLMRENGKLRAEATGEVMAAISEATFYAGLARMPQGRSAEVVPDSLSIIRREAAGVAAIIVPWNAPITLLVRSLAPALAAGCAVVVKPATQTTLVNELVLSKLLTDEAVPAGIVKLVNEDGTSVGRALAQSRNIDVISFTGSSATGKAIMAASAPTLKRLSLELGGKSPAIVFPDADLDRATRELSFGALSVAGQFCMCASRFLIHEDIADEMRDRLAMQFAAIRVGPASNPASQMGPVIDDPNCQRLEKLIEFAAKQETMILRGVRKGSTGSFLTPTLVGVKDVSSPLVQEELFGPIITFETFSSEAEALEKAHATNFGLAASVHTRDLDRAHRMAARLRCGTIWLNCHRRQFAEIEVGGFGDSGLGRLHGAEGLDDFLETKHIFLDYGGGPA